jgi:hypothetical protein
VLLTIIFKNPGTAILAALLWLGLSDQDDDD